MSAELSVRLGSLELRTPIIPASGVWPYEEEFWNGDKTEGLGAACTKAISLNPRKGNPGVRIWETPSGVLNSIGLQNVGVQGFIEKYHSVVSKAEIPAVANVVMEREEETSETLARLWDAGGIAAAELNISCPNVDGDGMAWGMEPCSAAKAVRAARKVWKGALWVKMTPQTADPCAVAKAIEAEGADALVCANTWLGMGMDMSAGRPAFERVVAGLSGPAVFPLALRLVWQVCGAVTIPVVACGGVSSSSDCVSMMLAGASAVEAGTVFFRNLAAGRDICGGIPAYLKQYGAASLREIIGRGRERHGFCAKK